MPQLSVQGNRGAEECPSIQGKVNTSSKSVCQGAFVNANQTSGYIFLV